MSPGWRPGHPLDHHIPMAFLLGSGKGPANQSWSREFCWNSWRRGTFLSRFWDGWLKPGDADGHFPPCRLPAYNISSTEESRDTDPQGHPQPPGSALDISVVGSNKFPLVETNWIGPLATRRSHTQPVAQTSVLPSPSCSSVSWSLTPIPAPLPSTTPEGAQGWAASSLRHPGHPRGKKITASAVAEGALLSTSVGEAQQAERFKEHDHNPRSSYPSLGLREGGGKETLNIEGRSARATPVLVSARDDGDDNDTWHRGHCPHWRLV